MDDLLDDLTRAARRGERAARTFNEGRFAEHKERLLAEVKPVHRAWSGSWMASFKVASVLSVPSYCSKKVVRNSRTS